MTVERNQCQQDSQSLCFLQLRNWQQCSVPAVTFKWQTWPAMHLNSCAGLQNCFLTPAFFKSDVFPVVPSREGAAWSRSSLCGSGCNVTWAAKLTLLSPPPSSPEAKQMLHPVPSGDFSHSQSIQLLQVVFILQLPSKPSWDCLPQPDTSHTCKQLMLPTTYRSNPICLPISARKAASSFPVPHIWACSESYPNTALAGWVN